MLRKRTVLPRVFAFASLFFVGGVATGCSRDAEVSKSDEEKFKNPPKDAKEKAAEYMRNHPGNGAPPSDAK